MSTLTLVLSSSSTTPHVQLSGDLGATGDLTVDTLIVGARSINVASWVVSALNLTQFTTTGTIRSLIPNATLNIDQSMTVNAAAAPLLGLVQIDATASLKLGIHILNGQPQIALGDGSMVMLQFTATGAFAFNLPFATGAGAITVEIDVAMPTIEFVGLQFNIGPIQLPGPQLNLPVIKLPRFTLPSIPNLIQSLPAFSFPYTGLHVSWQSLTFSIDSVTKAITADFVGLRVSFDAMPDIVLEGALHYSPATTTFTLTRPKVTFDVLGAYLDSRGLILHASNALTISGLVDAIAVDANLDVDHTDFYLRVLKDTNGYEVRVDVPKPAINVGVHLPGVDLNCAADLLTFACRKDNDPTKNWFRAYAAGGTSAVNIDVKMGFGWGKDANSRESTPSASAQDYLLDLQFTHAASAFSVVLADIGTSSPKFLQTPATPLVVLDPTAPKFDLSPAPNGLIKPGDGWSLTFAVNSNFDLPFVRWVTAEYQQLLTFLAQTAQPIDGWLQPRTIPFSFQFSFGDQTPPQAPIQLTGSVTLDFLQLKFQLDNDRIHLFCPNKTTQLQVLGFAVEIDGAPALAGPYAYLDLHLDGHSANLELADQAKVVLSLRANLLGTSPFPLDITHFAITEKGIDLDAKTRPIPYTLNGIGTQFTFNESILTIRGNQISGTFSLSGSGALPPALIDDGHVDITIGFKKQGTNIVPIGGAVVKFDKALACKSTRFQFAVHSIGFVVLPGNTPTSFQFYFTITATAKFVLENGEHQDGPLALLPTIELDLLDCPLAGDMLQHVQFLVTLQKPQVFKFLGCFEFELRGIGFIPKCPQCDDVPAMALSGQIKFSDGAGDAIDARFDFHTMFIGLPAPGSIFPRVVLEDLAVYVNLGDAFGIGGMVSYQDTATLKGFGGQGTIEIEGLPGISVGFAFMRLKPTGGNWVRAWFVAIEARGLSIEIYPPYIYLREVGLGFGYRYTLSAIEVANETSDIRILLKALDDELRKGTRFSELANWAPITTETDPVGTIAIRALFSQSSGEGDGSSADQGIPCLFLFDIVISISTDLTIFLAGNTWFCTNYYDYDTDLNVRMNPFLTNFILLQPRRQRFLAHMSKRDGATFGDHPSLVSFMKEALANCQFSMTLLIEPHLFQYEMGWPNLLRWHDSILGFTAEFRGGFLFRISSNDLVTGVSFLATASFQFQGGIDLGFIGAQVSASINVAYGGRYVGRLAFNEFKDSFLYAAVGLEIRASFSIRFWLHIDLFLFSIDIDITFSLNFAITAALEMAISGTGIGISGNATVEFGVFGHSLRVGVHIGLNEGAVQRARDEVAYLMSLGLEATDSDRLPGLPGPNASNQLVGNRPAPAFMAMPEPDSVLADQSDPADEPSRAATMVVGTLVFDVPKVPDYWAFHIPPTPTQKGYFVLFPKPNQFGFLPRAVKPYTLQIEFPGATNNQYAQYRFAVADPPPPNPVPTLITNPLPIGPYKWEIDPDAKFFDQSKSKSTLQVPDPKPGQNTFVKLDQWLAQGYITDAQGNSLEPISDSTTAPPLVDRRVRSAADADFEAAVRVTTQNGQAPYFKLDPSNNAFDSALYDTATTPTPLQQNRAISLPDDQKSTQALHIRGLMIHDLLEGFKRFVQLGGNDVSQLTENQLFPLHMGLVFSYSGDTPNWMADQSTSGAGITYLAPIGGGGPVKKDVFCVNPDTYHFDKASLIFSDQKVLSHSNTIAIDWNLDWNINDSVDDFLRCYEVSRISLDESEPEQLTTVKPGRTVHTPTDQNGNPLLGPAERLQVRFKFVDHFSDSTLASERRYLYTIKAIDFNGNRSKTNLTVSASRVPSEPPQPPSDAQLALTYSMQKIPDPVSASAPPAIHQPDSITLTFRQTRATDAQPVEPNRYNLYFRPLAELPIGAYGLDASGDQNPSGVLPSSLGAPLPSDILFMPANASFGQDYSFLSSDLTQVPNPDKSSNVPAFKIDLSVADVLSCLGFHDSPPLWQASGWVAYLSSAAFTPTQSGGVTVTSTLIPTFFMFDFELPAWKGAPNSSIKFRPSHLEFFTDPMQFPMVAGVDATARTGDALVPVALPNAVLPATGDPLTLVGGAATLKFIVRPPHDVNELNASTLQAFGFRWNAAPSGTTGPKNQLLYAGYRIWELDGLSHTEETFSSREKIVNALRHIANLKVVPSEDLRISPKDTLAPAQWEAWYPGLDLTNDWPSKDANGFDLVWPDVSQLNSNGVHQTLQAIVDGLNGPFLIDDPKVLCTLMVRGQAQVPSQSKSLSAFMSEFGAQSDPNGWAMLDSLGLSRTFTLYVSDFGRPATWEELFPALQGVVHDVITLKTTITKAPDPTKPAIQNIGSAVGMMQGMRIHFEQAGVTATIQSITDPTTIVTDTPVASTEGEIVRVVIDITSSVTTGANSVTQVIGSTVGMTPGMYLYFATSKVVAKIASITNSTTLILTAIASTTTLEVVRVVSETQAHLHLEVLVQPGSALRVQHDPVALTSSDLLAMVRISLRPRIESLENGKQPGSISDLDSILNKVISNYSPLPTSTPQDVVDAYKRWAFRFLTTGVNEPLDSSAVARLAVAYPRSGKPEVASPDAFGTVHYAHLRTDEWNSAYRYYIQTLGRYNDLWDAVAARANRIATTSTAATTQDPPPTIPAYRTGVPSLIAPPPPEIIRVDDGTDLVSRRIRPVLPPGYIRFGRIVPPGALTASERVSRIVELVLPRHPEALLSDANLTLKRKLGFVGVAVFPETSFAYQKSFDWLNASLGIAPYSPKDLSSNLGSPISGEDASGQIVKFDDTNPTLLSQVFGVPGRMSPYQRGADVYQFENLPHYRTLYVRLVAIAEQSSNETIASTADLEAVAPAIRAVLDNTGNDADKGKAFLAIDLGNLWESTPQHVKDRWSQDAPGSEESDTLPASTAPDPEFVYEIYQVVGATSRLVGDVRFVEHGDSLTPDLLFEPNGTASGFIFDPTPTIPITTRKRPLETRRFVTWLNFLNVKPVAFDYWLQDGGNEQAIVWTGSPSSDGVKGILKNIDDAEAALKLAGNLTSPVKAALVDLRTKVELGGPVWQTAYQFASAFKKLAPPDTLSAKAQNQLTGVNISGILWTGTLSVESDLPEVQKWAAIPEYSNAVSALIAAKASGFIVPVNNAAGVTNPPDGAVTGFGNLVFHKSAGTLEWTGGLPNDALLAALNGPFTFDPDFVTALGLVKMQFAIPVTEPVTPQVPSQLSGQAVGTTNVSIRTKRSQITGPVPSSQRPDPDTSDFETQRMMSYALALPNLGQLKIQAKRHGLVSDLTNITVES